LKSEPIGSPAYVAPFIMMQSSSQAIPASAITRRFVESLSRLHMPFENLLLLWFLLSPIAAFYLRFPLDKSVITFDRAVVFSLLLMLLLKYWQRQKSCATSEAQNSDSSIGIPPETHQSADSGLRTFSITKFEIAWLILAAVVLLNALWLSTNVSYAIKIAIDAFCLPLVLFHVARYQCRWRERRKVLTVTVTGLALLLFATGIYEFFTGANLFAYKGSTVFREGELRVNGPFASDSSQAIICLLVTLFLRLLPRLLQIKFDNSGRFVYFCGLAAAVIATLLPLFRTVALAMVLCWLTIEYLIHTKRPAKAQAPIAADESPVGENPAAADSPPAAPSVEVTHRGSRRLVAYSIIGLLLVTSFVAWTELSGSYLIGRLASPRNLYGRLATWQTAARIALENPVAGVGLTNYSQYFDVIFSDWQHQDIDWIGDIRAVDTPHSNFLWIASELGFSGFAPYLLANIYLLLMGLRALLGAKTREQLLASGGFLALLAAYTIPGLTLQSGFYADLNLYFFFMLGLLSNIFAEPLK
jgi:O-antigen ligase